MGGGALERYGTTSITAVAATAPAVSVDMFGHACLRRLTTAGGDQNECSIVRACFGDCVRESERARVEPLMP